MEVGLVQAYLNHSAGADMNRRDWKITGVFLGIVAGAVLILSLVTDGNVLNQPVNAGMTIGDLQQERESTWSGGVDEGRVRRDFGRRSEGRGLTPDEVVDFRKRIENHGYILQDGQVFRKSR